MTNILTIPGTIAGLIVGVGAGAVINPVVAGLAMVGTMFVVAAFKQALLAKREGDEP